MLYYSIGLNSFLSYITFSGLFCTFIWCSSACVFFCRTSILKRSSERLSNFLRKTKFLSAMLNGNNAMQW